MSRPAATYRAARKAAAKAAKLIWRELPMQRPGGKTGSKYPWMKGIGEAPRMASPAPVVKSDR